MFALSELYPKIAVLPLKEGCKRNLRLESTLQDLTLHDFQIEYNCPGREVEKAFAENALLPGVILTNAGQFAGMISRQRFLEHLSRPYGLELFLQRPIKTLYSFTEVEILRVPAKVQIMMAARLSLLRSPQLLYEPLVVESEPDVYKLLDVHQLLVAQSQIHELTARLLNEQTKAQMMQTEKMASLGRMVAGVAHEIRNPVNCIAGNINFLSKYTGSLIGLVLAYEEQVTQICPKISQLKEEIEFNYLIEDLPEIIASLKVGTEQLTQIVGSLRNFSHMDGGQRKRADIHACIDSTLLILKNRLKYGIEVVKNYGALPLVECYSGQLSQVFMNLISNALDALEEREERGLGESGRRCPQNTCKSTPSIWIATEVVEKDGMRWASIRIGDNGPGIPSEIQGRIFETFFTTKPVGKGTGLGLAISYQIVTEKHAGKLNLRSRSVCEADSHPIGSIARQPDTGTEFEILLPIEEPVGDRPISKKMVG